MKLNQVNLDKPLPGHFVGGRRMQHTLTVGEDGIARLELVGELWLLVENDKGDSRMIPMQKLASIEPLKERQPVAAPAKRRGRPPGSKNKVKPDEGPRAEESLRSD